MLDVKSVDLHYGAAQALRSVSMHAAVGEVTCVLGRNGVGKTSLLDALAGQQPISGGSIEWEGEDITKLKPYERARRGIAYVPQGRETFPLLTVEENLKTGFAPLKPGDRDIARPDRHRAGGAISGLRQRVGRPFRGDGSRRGGLQHMARCDGRSGAEAGAGDLRALRWVRQRL